MATKKEDDKAAEETKPETKSQVKAAEAKSYKPGDRLGELVATRAGLPNSCTETGEKIPAHGIWFARNDDEARSGVAYCQAAAEKMA